MISLEKLLESLLESSGRPRARTRGQVVERAMDAAFTLTNAHGVTMLLPAGRRAFRHVRPSHAAEIARAEVRNGGSEFSRLLARGGVPISSPDVSADDRMREHDACDGLDAGPALFIPLRLRESHPAYLAIYRERGAERFNERDSVLATMLAAWVSLALDNLRLSADVEKLAVTDDLTQVYNFRFLKSALRREIKRAGRFHQKLSLIMIDVDNLKAYNDRHGHLRGSYLLKGIAARFVSQVRSFDLIAKYGGDEFTIILPQTEREGAMIVAERMRATIDQFTFPLARPGQITVSLGVATFPDDADDATGLIQAADRALYVAKRQGRNRVETLGREAA